MRSTDTFRQYIWLVNTMLRRKSITLKQIKTLWAESNINEGRPLSRTTFYRLKLAVEDMFGLQICCDSSGHRYYIGNPEVLRDHSIEKWLLNTLTVNSIFTDRLTVKDRILLEDIPGGTEYLDTIINAIKHKQVLSMGYKKFDSAEGYTIPIEPYCLKVFLQRWYMLGRSPVKGEALQIYALDRMTELTETELTFEPDPHFDAKRFFSDFYGVFVGDSAPAERIVLRAYNKMADLMRTLPMHHSQREIGTTDNHTDFELRLVASSDFIHAILKEGHELEVIEPLSVRERIKTELDKAMRLYE